MSEQPHQPEDYRLPRDVSPIHYDLKILTDLDDLEFEGIVDIQLHVNKETSKIVLNALDLTVDEVSLHSDALNESQQATSRDFDSKEQRAIFTFAKALPPNSKARLSVSFKADITGRMAGYYRSLGGTDGKTICALTQFQPTAARRAFPCWDEPGLKATFALTMVSRKDTININNMPAESEEPYDPEKFQQESSYTSPLSGKARPMRFYVTAECIPQARFALDVLAKVMPVYEQMYDVEYPLPKLDLLAGLIVARTQFVLYDEASNNIQTKQSVASMVGHEVAHMWFGDITTMEWWDNLYLNEGGSSSTTMGDKVILGTIWPEWKSDSEFLTTSFSRARALDAKLSSHPVEVECPDANRILQIFDDLSYAKAASVLRMLSSYVGEERFMKGVSLYLKKHQYKNTVTKDLWAGIQAATGLDIAKMMDSWITQMGYPVVTVTEKEGGIHVRQDRFLETGPPDEKENQTIWVVPLSLLTVSEDGKSVVDKDILLDGREKFIPLDTSRPYKLNAGTTGFFVVKYSAARLVKLGQQAAAADSPFSLSDRIGLVLDAYALANAGYASLSAALGLVNSLASAETEYYAWDTIANNLSAIASTWYEHAHVVELLNAFRRELYTPLVNRLGFAYSETDSPNDQQLRTIAIEQAAYAGDPQVAGELKSRFDHFLKTGDDSKIPSDITEITFVIGVQEGGRSEWDFIKSIAQHPKSPAQGVAARRALGASKDGTLAEATFDYILNEARIQDVNIISRGLQRNPRTRKFLAEKVKEHFDVLLNRYEGTFNLARWIEISFQTLASEEDYEATVAFFKDKDTSSYDLPLKQSLDNIRARAACIKSSTDELVRWLEQRPTVEE
ncbi:peptidase family M1-domain-containing protein [Fomes fomentarius]|nr:peptidase family M1-domain-containing protein [Fomes fomentarius]